MSAASRRRVAPAVQRQASLNNVVGAKLTGGVTRGEREAWGKVLKGISDMGKSGGFPPTREKNFEVTVVRAVLAVVLAVAAGTGGAAPWRYEREATVLDDVPLVQAKPDHSLTHARDAQVSVLGAHLIVEDKCPGDVKAARTQARKYGRRRVQELVHLARDTGVEAPTLAKVSTLVVATDVLSAHFIRVMSGWPINGKSFDKAKPFPSKETKALELLPGFTGLRPTGFARGALSKLKEPTEGFLALYRLLRLPGGPDHEVFVSCSPGASVLAELTATFEGDDDDGDTISLEARLGVGGISDVYKVAGAGGGVVKYPRHTSTAVVHQFTNEFDVLKSIGGDRKAKVPWGVELGSVLRTRFNESVRWPVLRMKGPVGESLVAAVAGCANQSARVELANKVVGAVLRTLQAAHSAGFIHCDVRPANIVLAKDTAYLVDWGVSRKRGVDARCQGVPAYAAPDVFTETARYRARAAMDVCGALCTWIAIVHGGASMEVPWIDAATSGADEARMKWLRDNSELVGVAAVQRALTQTGAEVSYALPRRR